MTYVNFKKMAHPQKDLNVWHITTMSEIFDKEL